MKKISALAIAGVFAASFAGTAFAEMADVKVGGEIRVRDEWQNNYSDFNKDTGDQHNMIVQRTRVNVDAKVDEKVRAYVSLENNRNWGSSGPAFSNTAGDSVGLYQGYVQLDKLFDQPLSFKAGRQKMALGSQRLIGANDWQAGQSFDGWNLGYSADAFNVNLFALTIADTNSSGTTRDSYLNGLYVTVKSIPMNTLDVYAIQKEGQNTVLTGTSATASTTVDGASFITYGARIDGNAMNIDWNAEAAFQSGDSAKIGTTTVSKSANAFWLRAGYTVPQAAGLRIGAEYDQLSGNKSTDTDDKSFDQLYPTKHAISQQYSVYGITDIVEKYIAAAGHPGLQAFSINASAKPVEGLKLLAEYWNYSTAEDYATASGTSKKVGSEVNVQAWYDLSKSTSLHAYYAQFTPESDFSNGVATGKTDAATDAVLQLQVAF